MISATILLSSCGLGGASDSVLLEADDAETVVNAAAEALQSAPTGLGLVAQTSMPTQAPSALEHTLESLLPTAVASSGFCRNTATLTTCSNVGGKNLRTRSFDCSFGLRGATASGQVQLEYSNASCLFSSVNSEIVRSVDLTLTGKRGREIQISSDVHADFRGESIGGGQKLVRTAANEATLEILGMNRKLMGSNGQPLVDVSTRSLGTLQLATGSVIGDLRVQDGRFEVIHNRAKFVTTWTASNLAWTTGCNCPTVGTLSATLSGSKTGSLVLSFKDSCGVVDLTQNDQSPSEIVLDQCEQI